MALYLPTQHLKDNFGLVFYRTMGNILEEQDENCHPKDEEDDCAEAHLDSRDILKRSLKKLADLSSFNATPTTSRKRLRNPNSSGAGSQENSLNSKSKKRLRFAGPEVDDFPRKLENDFLETAFETPTKNSRFPVVVLSPQDIKSCDKLPRK